MIINAISGLTTKTLKSTIKQAGIMEDADDQIHNHHRKGCWELPAYCPESARVIAADETEEDTVELMI